MSICRVGERLWRVTIVGDKIAAYTTTGPRKALVRALRLAEEMGMEGVDLGMGWAYEHPQYPEPK